MNIKQLDSKPYKYRQLKGFTIPIIIYFFFKTNQEYYLEMIKRLTFQK